MENFENKKKEIQEYLESLFLVFFWIIDYYEVKITEFLLLKIEIDPTKLISKYNKLVILKIILFIATLITHAIALRFVGFYVYLVLIAYLFFGLYWHTEKYFYDQFKHSKSFYRKEKRHLFNYRKKLILLMNNHSFNDNLKECSFKNKYKNQINAIEEKINFFGLIFKPINVIIEQLKLVITIFTIILTIILTFFFNLLEILIPLYQDQIYIDWESVFMLICFVISIIGQSYLYYSQVYEWKWHKYEAERKDLNKMEGIFYELISMIMPKLKIIESIRESEISKNLPIKLFKNLENEKNKSKEVNK